MTPAMTRPTSFTKPSLPVVLLHAEGLAVLISAIAVYAHLRGNAWLFVLLLFTPDVFMLGYLKNVQLGSIIYNIGHTYIVPIVVLAIALYAESFLGVQIGIIWFAHIGLDRLMGYGLKYPTNFKDTHLQRV
jgi:hypothetical protein